MATNRKDVYWVGFDLGGTKMLAVLFDRKFRPIARQRKRTDGQAGADAVVARIIALVRTLLAERSMTMRRPKTTRQKRMRKRTYTIHLWAIAAG